MVELFAGVGGFRIGFEGAPGTTRNKRFKVVWANQWEPSTKKQHAAEVYSARWGLIPDSERPTLYVNSSNQNDVFVNEDISTIEASEIPRHDLLCGGFPCQDYSVAKTLDKAKGLSGKKGVLWWEIHRIAEYHRPSYLLLENVDRLLKSPKGQRGRDFAVMLASLEDLDYAVEWRMVDASTYGFPQRRKRVFILAHGPGTPGHESLTNGASPQEWMEDKGVLARSLPILPLNDGPPISLPLREKQSDDLADISDHFNTGKSGKDPQSPFLGTGVMVNGKIWTSKTTPKEVKSSLSLGEVLQKPEKIPDEFILTPESLINERGWIYLKGAKRELRTGTDGFTYRYSEGPITFPDALDRASRTIITGEGGKGASRFKHVVKFRPTKKQVERMELRSDDAAVVRKKISLGLTEWVRRLTPIELERLNGFPDNHTKGVTDGKRAFFMGNALVCGIVSRIAKSL